MDRSSSPDFADITTRNEEAWRDRIDEALAALKSGPPRRPPCRDSHSRLEAPHLGRGK
jgi:hypothetical protein